jgi:hypothetical protein
MRRGEVGVTAAAKPRGLRDCNTGSDTKEPRPRKKCRRLAGATANNGDINVQDLEKIYAHRSSFISNFCHSGMLLAVFHKAVHIKVTLYQDKYP